VTFILEDEEGKPPVGVRKAEKLIRQDKVHVFVGGLLASTGYALAPISTRLKVTYIPSVAAADDLTQRDAAKYPYVMRTGWTSSQPSHPFGEWACEQGYKRIAVVAADYAFGYEVAGGFQKAFEDCGGRIVQKIWPPLGTNDFGPYIPTIKKDVDAIFTVLVGPMALQFPKQIAAAGIKKPVIGGGTSYDEFVLPSMGDEVIGHVSALQYSAAIDSPKKCGFREEVPREIRQSPLVLLRDQLHHRPDDPRSAEANQGQMAGPGKIHQDAVEPKAGHGARSGAVRRAAQSDPEHLRQEGREKENARVRQGRAVEYGDQDLSQREPVLQVRQGQIPEAAGLQPRLPAVQVLRMTHHAARRGATKQTGWHEA
jgi:hypothetical protein